MKNTKESKIVFLGMFGLQWFYFIVLLIAILFKAYRFSDMSFLLIFLLLGIIITISLSLYYMSKFKASGIEICDKLKLIMFLQIPSTLIFVFTLIIVITAQYVFN